ncbi:MAG TPA: malto-oligosyltrehalose synthase [Vicinamibacterales bacterium]|nr:malto-oligosyltrehalose synthase [Vicinamibacterales bacterium]
MEKPRFVPASTYRLQIHAGFPLDAARGIVPYLQRLGIGAVYTSPYFAAEAGSTHGYDVTNHNLINPEVGGIEAHTAFTDAVGRAGLQHIVDFVPNHMGISTATNPWWRDVLANGPDSPSARFFDIDWNPFKAELRRKLLLPILGDQYGQVLDRGELQLELVDGRLVLKYFDNRLPINPHDLPELQGLAEASPEAAARVLAAFNGTPGDARSFDRLHELLEAQAYRLAYWRTAAHEINYRRFFDVNTLAGLRVEDPHVFEAIHRLLAALLREGRVTGIRVDHPDGLFDPARYFENLQALAAEAWGVARRPGTRIVYVLAEKILSGRERLPREWQVHGTTGYNFLNQLNGVFVHPGHARRMRRTYAKLTGQTQSFDDLLYESKRLIIDTALASELTVLAHMLDRIGENNRKSRDFTLNSIRDMLGEVVACFPIYRTYVDGHGWAPDDRAALERAVAHARRRNPAMESSIFDFFRDVMLPRDPSDQPTGVERRGGYPPADEDEVAARLRFAMKFQQYTGPLQAKGLEDTAFYRHNLLLSLNEVGGDPSRFGLLAPDFHAMNQQRRQEWPYEMSATATHDTKHGEDVRARINVLSELPAEWEREVARWMRINKSARTIVDGDPAPDRNDEYRFYQALLGAWPFGDRLPDDLVPRMRAYMIKSVKEAKRHTSWLSPDEQYENALTAFVERVLAGSHARKFLPAFLPFQQKVSRGGAVNSLAQVVLKIASPGVPDFYQGTELWDLNLVDPDNRRPVDFLRREQMLDNVDAVLALPADQRRGALERLAVTIASGGLKLLITAAGLRLRAAKPDLFLEGEYLPLEVECTVDARAIAFARQDGAGNVALAVAPHLTAPLITPERPMPTGDLWRTSRIQLPEALTSLTFTDVFTGATHRPVTSASGAWLFVGQVLDILPIALLSAETGSTPDAQLPTSK